MSGRTSPQARPEESAAGTARGWAGTPDRIVLIKGKPREFLREALGNGLLNGEALKAADAVMAENAALRRDNAILAGRLQECRKTIHAYRDDHLAALNYRYDKEQGWRYSAAGRRQMMLAVAGLTVAFTCLVLALAWRW